MGSPPRLFALHFSQLLRNKLFQGLKHKMDFRFTLDLWKEHFFDRILDLITDDKNNLVEPATERIEQRVVHDRFTGWPKAIDLFDAAVAAAHPGSHDQK